MGLLKLLRDKWDGKQDMAQQQPGHQPTLDERLVALERFWFLADTPLFVDNVFVSRLYDAVFRPEVEFASQSDATTSEVAAKVVGGAKASVEVGKGNRKIAASARNSCGPDRKSKALPPKLPPV